MKWIYILALIAPLGILNSSKAQDYASARMDTATVVSSSDKMAEADAGEVKTFFNTPVKKTRSGSCALIQNQYKDRKLYNHKNGYKLKTQNNDEVLEVKNEKGGGRKLNYYNDYETLNYHHTNKGTEHYRYTYYNECKKVKVHKNKKGITSVTNKQSGMDADDVSENVQKVIKRGANTCTSVKYSK